MALPHLMLDLETMGRGSDAAIVQIGAIAFQRGGFNEAQTFFCNVSLASAQAGGGVIDAGTVLWWLQLPESARRAVFAPSDPLPMAVALQNFTRWFEEHCGPDTMVWGNGSDFDNVILRNAYRRMGQTEPWGAFRNRCFRTLKAAHPRIPYDKPANAHHALSDAIAQAEHLIKLPLAG